MKIIQFEDKNLSHYSYALISGGKMALIDPERNPEKYLKLAEEESAKMVSVIETHPHADFVSSHLEVHESTGATIYVSKLLGAEYPHRSFDEGDELKIGAATLIALNTPGHSPDSICILAQNEEGKPEAVFTGDTLFIGDCGRPDLREKAGALTAAREHLASQMYHSLRDKLMPLPDEVLVYPAHGAGSLCGRGLSSNNSSTIGVEKASNWSLGKMTEEDFVQELLSNQPFVPKYFGYDVMLNKKGAAPFADSVSKVKILEGVPADLDPALAIIDTREGSEYQSGALPNSINLMEGNSFETWLGSIIAPEEKFYLQSASTDLLQEFINRTAKIGYEGQIAAAFVLDKVSGEIISSLDLDGFKNNKENYTILDIRNPNEVESEPIFAESVHIPLYELRERVGELPTGKPVVVHCAAGYRSAAGTSIVKNKLNGTIAVYDLGEAVNDFK